MNKIELEKNRLDLSYQRNLQLLNSNLLIGFGTLVSYFAGIILNPEKIYPYTIVGIIIAVITYLFYRKIDLNLKDISLSIKNLK